MASGELKRADKKRKITKKRVLRDQAKDRKLTHEIKTHKPGGEVRDKALDERRGLRKRIARLGQRLKVQTAREADIKERQSGQVVIAPYANRAGVSIRPEVIAFLKDVARTATWKNKVVVTCGTNHNRYVLNSTMESRHWTGHAADLGCGANGGANDSPRIDKLCSACLQVAGHSVSEANALARQGGVFYGSYHGETVQILWKTYVGGNHHNHVHVSVG